MSKAFKLFILLSICIYLSGCSLIWGEEEESEPETSEVPSEAAIITDGTPDQLYEASKRLYQSGAYTVALRNFENLRDTFPQGPYLEFAELKVADTNFYLRRYETAATLFDEFIQKHPGSPSREYALFTLGRCYQFSGSDVGKDSNPFEKAIQTYDQFLKEFPESLYRKEAVQLRKEATHQIAKSEMEIIDFYRKQEKYDAVEARLDFFEKKWGTVLSEDIQKNEEFALAVIRADNSRFADTTIQSIQQQPTLARASLRISDKKEKSSIDSPIRKITCDPKRGKNITVMFQQGYESTLENTIPQASTEKDSFTLKLPAGNYEEQTIDCLGKQDLSISENGTLKIQSVANATIFPMSYPSRIVINPR